MLPLIGVLWACAVSSGSSSSVCGLPVVSAAQALSPSPWNPEQSLPTSEEDGRQVREALLNLLPCSPPTASPPSIPELLPVCVDPVRGVESIRGSPLLLGENAVDFGWPRETQNRCPARGHPCEIVALS